MPLPFTRNPSRGHVGLDIDGRYLAAAEVHAGKVVRVASAELPAGLVAEGEITDGDGLAAALKEFFRANGLPRNVRLGVANKQIVVRQLEIPHIPNERDRDVAIRFQATEMIAMPLDDAVLDYQLVEQIEQDGALLDRIVVVAARAPMVEQLVDAVTSAGLKVTGIDLSAFSLVRTLAEPIAEGGPKVARVFCHLGSIANLAIATGTACGFTRSLTTGLDPEHSDEAIASTVADEIQLSLNFHQSQPGARPVSEIVLSGPEAEREGLVERLEALTGHPVTIAEPFGKLHPPIEAGEGDPSRYTVAAGLAAAGSGAVDLLPGRARFQAEPVKNGSALVLGALAILLAAAVGFVVLGNQVSARETELAEAKAATERARAQGGELRPFEQFATLRKARVETIKNAAGGRVDWERTMRELALVLPEGTWITEADASATGTPGSAGQTPLPGEAAGAGSPAVKLIGCAKNQRRVAVTLVRLRQMSSATDVTLAESTEEEDESGGGDAGASEAGCGAGNFKFDATVTFAAKGGEPSEQTSAEVPARLGGGQ